MIKNTASQKIGAQMVSATDGSAFTGSVTVSVTVDAGVQAGGAVGAGACTHEGNGYHTYAPSQAETNGDLLAFTFTGTGAIPATVQVYTLTGDAFARLGAPAGASVSADVAVVAGYIDTEVAAILAAVDTEVAAIKAKTDQFVFTTANQVDARVFTNSDKTGYTLAAGGIPSGAHAAAELNAMADAFLDRNMATGTDSGTDSTAVRTVRQALRRMRNKEAIAAGTGTVYKEDDATTSFTYAATTAAGNPISAVDPT
jgi:hypothetical protein